MLYMLVETDKKVYSVFRTGMGVLVVKVDDDNTPPRPFATETLFQSYLMRVKGERIKDVLLA